MKKMLSNFMIISVLISGCGNDENNTSNQNLKLDGEYNIENIFLNNEKRKGDILTKSIIPSDVTLTSNISNNQNFFDIYIKDSLQGRVEMHMSFVFKNNELESIYPFNDIQCNSDKIIAFPITADINDTSILSLYTCNDGSILTNATWKLSSIKSENFTGGVFELNYDIISSLGKKSKEVQNTFFIFSKGNIQSAVFSIIDPYNGDKTIINTIMKK